MSTYFWHTSTNFLHVLVLSDLTITIPCTASGSHRSRSYCVWGSMQVLYIIWERPDTGWPLVGPA